MATTFTLPDGGTAVIRDPKTVTEAQRRPVTRLQMRLAVSPVGQLLARKAAIDDDDKSALDAIDKEFTDVIGNDADSLTLLDDLNDALISALVESVNGAPVVAPTDLAGPAYDALRVETAKHLVDLMPAFAPNPDPASPTQPSAT